MRNPDRKYISLLMALLLAACLPSAGTPPSDDVYIVPANIAEPAPGNAVRDVLRLINGERTKRGLKPLTVNPMLTAAARSHADYMAVNDCYAHICPGEPLLPARVKQTGYIYRKITENIHAAQLDPQRLVTGWMRSPTHRKNILDPNVTEIGIGHRYLARDDGPLRHHHYWVTNFGAPFKFGA